MKYAVALQDVEYTWPGNPQPTLHIPRWSTAAESRVFVYGPSGSGKSTLLNLIAGIMRPQKGDIHVCGEKISSLGTRARDRFRARNTGMIFQQFNLLPYLTVRANIALAPFFGGASMANAAGIEDPEAELRHLLERLRLPAGLLTRRVSQLSVGQQQRVAVARALINRPRVLIADEPSSALDMDARDDFLGLLLDCSRERGMAVLFVSHDRSIASLFDEAVDLRDINRAQEGSADAAARRLA